MSNTPSNDRSDTKSTSDRSYNSAHDKLEANCEQGEDDVDTMGVDTSDFEPTNLVEKPNLTLEEFEASDRFDFLTSCTGRGRETAAVRGYNIEKFATTVFSEEFKYFTSSSESWYDTFTTGSHDVGLRIESKSCVYRYPSGPYGRFRIWGKHHDTINDESQRSLIDTQYVYFFLVYKSTSEGVREVGKLVAPVEKVDKVLDKWVTRDHPTMGESRVQDISWYQLLKRLEVSKSIFRDQPIVDLTDGVPSSNNNS